MIGLPIPQPFRVPTNLLQKKLFEKLVKSYRLRNSNARISCSFSVLRRYFDSGFSKNDSEKYRKVENNFLFCPSNFPSQLTTNNFGFNVNWLLQQIHHEFSSAQHDFAVNLNETVVILTQRKPQQRLGSSVGFAALAAVGVFRGGLAAVGSDYKDLRGSVEKRQDQSEANAANVGRLACLQSWVTDNVIEFMTNWDEKIFLVENEVAALNGKQL